MIMLRPGALCFNFIVWLRLSSIIFRFCLFLLLFVRFGFKIGAPSGRRSARVPRTEATAGSWRTRMWRMVRVKLVTPSPGPRSQDTPSSRGEPATTRSPRVSRSPAGARGRGALCLHMPVVAAVTRECHIRAPP